MSKITEFVKANKKATVIGAIVLVLVIVGVAVALTTGDKKGGNANGTKTESSQSTTDKKNEGTKEDGNTSNGGGLQVVDPTKDDVKEDSIDVSGMFEDDSEGDKKDDKKDDSKNNKKDDKKDDSKDGKDEQWSAFY